MGRGLAIGIIPGIVRLLPFRWARRVDQCDCGALPDFGLIEPLFCKNLTFGQVVVGCELADAQMVVGENSVTPLCCTSWCRDWVRHRTSDFSSRQLERDKIHPSRVRLL